MGSERRTKGGSGGGGGGGGRKEGKVGDPTNLSTSIPLPAFRKSMLKFDSPLRLRLIEFEHRETHYEYDDRSGGRCQRQSHVRSSLEERRRRVKGKIEGRKGRREGGRRIEGG